MARLRILTWNINSVRPRVDHLRRMVDRCAPDVLCLQEIKCRTEEFPAEALRDLGFPHLAVQGQKGLHGVAIAARQPLGPAPRLDVCREGHARHVSATVAGVEIHNLYVPAGGDVPDPEVNPKFAHKLDFLAQLTSRMAARSPSEPIVLAGDLNIAPGEFDVWNHRHMSKIVSHTPVEVAALERLRASLGFIDVVRAARPDPEKVFTWWSYRAVDYRASNRGLRLDHLWVSPALGRAAGTAAGVQAQVHEEARGWERPSDHAPVSLDLDA